MKKRGIAKAVEQEILASYEQLYRLAITYVKNEQDAMDVVQESAYKAMKNAGGMNVTLGVLMIVFGIAAGVLMIVTGGKLLVKKADILF